MSLPAVSWHHFKSFSALVATWIVIVFGSFSLGALAIRSPAIAIVVVGLLGSVVIYASRPEWIIWIAVVSAFATMPSFVPAAKMFGSITVYVYEALIFLAFAYLILAGRRWNAVSATPAFYLWFVVLAALTGFLNGNERQWIIHEAKPLLLMIVGFVIAQLVVSNSLLAQAAKVASGVLWFSALMVFGASLAIITLQGGARRAGTTDEGVEVQRFFTPTQSAAFAVLVFVIACYVIAGMQARVWLMLGLPALIVTFFSFTRFSFYGALAAAVAAGMVSRSRGSLTRVAKIFGALLAVVLFLTLYSKLMPPSLGGEWVAQLLETYVDRIFVSLKLFAEGRDPSYAARAEENVHLWGAISEAPLFGHGLGYAYQAPFGPADSFTATTGMYFAHNLYLWLLAKTGIVGLAGFVFFALFPVARAVRSPAAGAKASGVVGAVILAVSLVAPAAESGPSALVLGIVLGAAMALSAPRVRASLGHSAEAVGLTEESSTYRRAAIADAPAHAGRLEG